MTFLVQRWRTGRAAGGGAGRRDQIGTGRIVANVISAATPLTVIGGVVALGFATTEQAGIPIYFVVVGVVLVAFVGGLVAMSRHLPYTGGLYSYLARGLGRPTGAAGAWIALAAYFAMGVGLFGMLGPIASPLVQQALSLDSPPPWWAIALAAWALVAFLGTRGVAVTSTVLMGLMVVEIAIVAIYAAANLANPAEGSVMVDGLAAPSLLSPEAGALFILAILGFIGVESPVVHTERTRDPQRTIPRAMYVSITLAGIAYFVSAAAMVVTAGPDKIVELAQTYGPELIFHLAEVNLGGPAVDIGRIVFAFSLLAAAISFHSIWSGYALNLGREHVLPPVFGRSSRRHAPIVGSLVQSAGALAVILVWASFGWNPEIQLFLWVGGSGGLGVLILLATTSIAVAAFLARHPQTRQHRRRLAAAVAAAIALTTIAVLAVTDVPNLLGVPATSPLGWIVPAIYLALGVGGGSWAFWLKHRHPSTYAGIGSGVRSLTYMHTPEDTMTTPDIRTITKFALRPNSPDYEPEMSSVAATITDSFKELKATHWLVPDDDDRREVLAAMYRLDLDVLLAHGGRIDVLGEYQAVAAWIELREPLPQPMIDQDHKEIREAAGRYNENFLELQQKFADNHPQNYPHWYLMFIATDPDHRNRGYAKTLLNYRLAQLSLPVYLEAADDHTIQLYSRYGFEKIGSFQLDNGATFTPMWRDAVHHGTDNHVERG